MMKSMHVSWLRIALCGAFSLLAVSAAQVRGQEQTLSEQGVIAGTMEIDFKSRTELDSAGTYTEGSLESPLRIAIDAIGQQPAFTDKFGGKLIGKSKKEDNLASYTYKRIVGNKTIQMKVAKVDPMKFVDLELAKGPAGNYPRTTVNGTLDFDYETGNWLTEGIRFRYNMNGKDTEDIVTGSVKWVEDDNRKTNGKGEYQFNLRWNEAKQAPATTESAAFAKLSDEDAFFAVDDSLPCLTGKITYEDKFISGEETPASSKVVFALNSNKLTKTQVVNFFKLWMIGIGPINDE
jgi:hypothetical protein